jgi:hypothetical protein
MQKLAVNKFAAKNFREGPDAKTGTPPVAPQLSWILRPPNIREAFNLCKVKIH